MLKQNITHIKTNRGVKTPIKTHTMKETIQLLKDYSSTRDIFWLFQKIELLEAQIDVELIKAEIKGYKR